MAVTKAIAIRCQTPENSSWESGVMRVGNMDCTIPGMMLIVQWMATAIKMLVLVLRNRTVMIRLKRTVVAVNLRTPLKVLMTPG